MKNKRLRNRIIAVIAAIALIVIAAIPALADQLGTDPNVYTPVSGTQTEFTKYLVIDNDSNVPGNAVFGFKIKASSGTDATDTTLMVYDGVQDEKIRIYESGAAEPTFTSGSYKVSFVGYSGSFTSGAANDKIANSTEKKYAQKTVIIDFSGVAFPLPGVYRYEISEENTVGYTTDSAKTLDVFVVNDDSASGAKLKVDGYIMYDKTTTAGPTYISGTTTSGTAFPSGTAKSKGFINRFPSVDLVVEKKVAGNQADKSEYFEFKLNISHASPNTQYTVDISKMVVDTSGTNSGLKTRTIETDDEGKIEDFRFKLQHGQSIRIYGLAEGTFYSVQEVAGNNGADLDSEGYTTTIDVTTNGTGNAVAGTNTSTRTIELSGTGSGAGIREINTVTFTNTKNGTLPTGVNMKVVPIVVVALLFIGGISVLTVRMARKENEE